MGNKIDKKSKKGYDLSKRKMDWDPFCRCDEEDVENEDCRDKRSKRTAHDAGLY